MPYTIEPLRKNQVIPSFHKLLASVNRILLHTPPLESKGDRPLQMKFEHQLKSLFCRNFSSRMPCVQYQALTLTLPQLLSFIGIAANF